jgi:hypothetical protein
MALTAQIAREMRLDIHGLHAKIQLNRDHARAFKLWLKDQMMTERFNVMDSLFGSCPSI